MNRSAKHPTQSSVRPESVFVDLLGGFLKATFVYPDNNPRVHRAAAELLAWVHANVPIGAPLVVQTNGAALAVGSVTIEAARPLVEWLVECMAKAPLTGVRFSAALQLETLFEFSRCMQRSQHPGVDFATCWTNDQPGLQPILVQPAEPAIRGSPAAIPGDDGGVRAALDAITELVSSESIGGEPFDVDELLQLAMARTAITPQDHPAQASALVLALLGTVQSALVTHLEREPFLETHELREVALRVLGAAIAPVPHAPSPHPTTTATRPAEHDDADGADVWRTENAPPPEDLVELEQEFAQLPRGHVTLTPWDPKLSAELLGVHLHLISCDDGWQPRAQNGAIRDLLRRSNRDQIRVLEPYAGGGPARTSPRITDFLGTQGLTHLLGTTTDLTPDQVIQTFPTQLLPFLDSLDARSRADRAKFQAVVLGVESTTMLDAIRLMLSENLLNPARTEKIFALGGRTAADIARCLADSGVHWARGKIIQFLRRENLPPAESIALRIVRPFSALTSTYLSDLCESIDRTRGSARMHSFTSYLLRQFVRDNADRPETLEQRLYAIRTLAYVGNPETIEFLEQLSRSGRLLQQSKDARSIRAVAAESLRQIRAGGPSL